MVQAEKNDILGFVVKIKAAVDLSQCFLFNFWTFSLFRENIKASTRVVR